jgi:hypothetical protein
MAEAQVHVTRNCNKCSRTILILDYYICKKCNTELCDRSDCLDSHRKDNHDVFHVNTSGEYRVDERVSDFCDGHPEITADFFCQTCTKEICLRCSSLNHNGHDVVDTTKVLADKMKLVEKDTLKLTRCPLKAFDTAVCYFEDKIVSTEENYEGIDNAIDNIKHKWMAEVNSVTQALKASVAEMKDGHIGDLRSQKRSFEMHQSRIKERILDNQTILRQNNSKMLRYESNIDEMFSFPSLTEVSLPTFKLGNLENAYSRMSTQGNLKYTPSFILSREEILGKSCLCVAEMISPKRREIPGFHIDPNGLSVPTLKLSMKNEFKSVQDMSTTKSSVVWIYDASEESIAILRENESKITMFTNIITEFIVGMSETEVLYTCKEDNTIKSLSVNGSSATLFSTGEWSPYGMATSKDGSIFVCQRKEGVGKVSKFMRNGEKIRDFIAVNDKILYEKPNRVAENINGDVCTIDLGSPNAVVIVSRLGKFKARYEGETWNSRRFFSSPPQPSSICTDSYGNIIVCDGNKFHVLDIAGDFVQHLDVRVSSPSLISVDKQDFLWVIEKQQTVKLFEYLKKDSPLEVGSAK